MIRFDKMHGLQNDFVVLELPAELATLPRARQAEQLSRLAVAMCHRRTGVGADGIIIVAPSRIADYAMRVINADGSEPEMCGNGLRCAAGWLAARGKARELRFETGAGTLTTWVEAHDPMQGSSLVRVDMGEPRLLRAQIPMLGAPAEPVLDQLLEVGGVRYVASAVSMGNPHCILFLDAQEGTPLAGCALDALPLAELGPRIEQLAAFPARTNVELAQVLGPDELAVRVWERGVGITQACGTGACATMVAAHLTGRVGPRAQVHLAGGSLLVEWAGAGSLFMSGPCQRVFTGTWQG